MEGAAPCPETSSAGHRDIHIVPDFSAYRNSSILTDVTVIVGTTEFECHRVILTAASDFFKAAFTCGLREDCERKITLEDIDKNIFSTILTYMYTGKIELTEKNLPAIWRAAHMLLIAPVIKECEEFFKTVLRIDNCCEFFSQVKLLSEKFRRRMLDLIADNFVNLRGSSNFNRFDAEDMKYLICSDRLNLAHEDDLIETLLQWAENDPHAGSIDDTHGATSEDRRAESSVMVKTVDDTHGAISEDRRAESRFMVNTVGTASDQPKVAESPDCELSKPYQAPGPCLTRVQQMADLLECTRYFLMSRNFFGERLACHPLIRADARCVALVERILRCHAQTCLLQEWCPPASVQRIQSKMVNSLVGAQVVVSETQFSFNLFAIDLVNQKTITIKLVEEFSVLNPIQIVYRDDKMYIFPGDGSVIVYCVELDLRKELGRHIILKSRLCVIGDWLYSCRKEKNGRAVVNRLTFHSLHSLSDKELSYHQVGSLHLDVQESIIHITSIENTLVIFCKCRDGVSIIFFDTFSGMSTRISTPLRIPSNHRFVTLRKDREVFVLEENGRFWRIRHCQIAQDFKLIHELTIWDETWLCRNRLCGAALVNDELLVVFVTLDERVEKLQEQQQPSNPLNANLAGVFNKVVIIKHPIPLNMSIRRPNYVVSPVIHAAIPKAIFEKMQRQKYTPIHYSIFDLFYDETTQSIDSERFSVFRWTHRKEHKSLVIRFDS
ncbi:kelch-like protein 40a [Plakobranchus ocellatus]|uniref:Kelch-like protein 40a n=1 Tax=Plakobranchus ocellatus TaxID=259542 RepID=A0AAV4CL67_9GAST|nr:kelch-like protein 40a [Plakobranchus ocellatus]